MQIEGQEVAGKVQAILPLPERFSVLRELATPFAAAWVVVPNPKGELEPGLRVRTGDRSGHADRHGPQARGETR